MKRGTIAGHILFTKIKIVNEEKSFASLALAPVSSKTGFQNQGIGAKLILEGHRIAEELGYESVILIGHEKYYPRFGYKKQVILEFLFHLIFRKKTEWL